MTETAFGQPFDPLQTSSKRSAWMQEAKWGVMTHYLFDWIAREQGLTMDPEGWNALVDGFDVEGLAEQLRSVGAGYHILTIGQNSGYYLAPNPTYDRLVGIRPSRCSRRDLVSDMSAALRKRGIRLIVYLPSGAPNGDAAAREALQWQNGPHPNLEFREKWEAIVRDWSLRFGGGIDGWWFDGCYWPNIMYRTPDTPNFATLAQAARTGNPASVVAFNPGVVPRILSLTPHEDYTAGEISDPATLSIRRAHGGRIDGKQIHVLSHLGRTWGLGAPRFSTEQVVGWSRDVRKEGGVVTWDVPVEPAGRLKEPFLEQLGAVGSALAGGTR
jgi:alpha-L-fucosidase